MIENISNYYYNEALDCAKNNDISGSLKSLKKLPKDSYVNIEIKKLTALCFMRLGYYSKAYDYALDIEEYSDFFKNSLLKYESFIDIFVNEINLKNYKGALKILSENSGKSVIEYNMEGILYFLIKDFTKGKERFLKALELDIYNSTTIHFILNIKDKKDSNFIYTFIQKILRR